MSRYLNERYEALTAYVPGEQPQDRRYVKLNTNESPYPPSPSVIETLNAAETENLNLYSDPEALRLRGALAGRYGVERENVLVVNGSDEALSFAFMAFCGNGVAYPDVSYGFYRVFAALYGLDALEVPLKGDFSIDPADYVGLGRAVVIANPNAPTGLFLSVSDIEKIVAGNPDHVVLIDEAYVDFGGESAISLTKAYDNLLVTQTYSKSRSMAGARLGYAIGSAELIADLEKIRCSTNPYNVNRLTLAAGEAALRDEAYYAENARKIAKTREDTKAKLRDMGFMVTDSLGNFLFAGHPDVSGEAFYRAFKEKGVLVRHFNAPRTKDYMRITVGSPEQMDILCRAAEAILKEARA